MFNSRNSSDIHYRDLRLRGERFCDISRLIMFVARSSLAYGRTNAMDGV